ncbi:hypothetical protein BT69DRAFT_1306756 [Atractiella rhizophila]|nr:hypothetical protein BT69DRAFT_1306756 [Atractiella rhizophila]
MSTVRWCPLMTAWLTGMGQETIQVESQTPASSSNLKMSKSPSISSHHADLPGWEVDTKSIRSMGIDEFERQEDPTTLAQAVAAASTIDTHISLKKRSLASKALDGWRFSGKEWACFFTLVGAV